MIQKFPRAPAGQTCAIQGDIWNRLADAIEAFGNFQVAPPLMMSNVAGKILISLAPTSQAAVIPPTGQYQYMGYMMVAQNQTGWDFSRGHGLV